MEQTMDDRREGEIALDFDPVTRKDASVAFIGHIQTPWTSRDEAPRNVIEARERSTEPARITLDPAFAPASPGWPATAMSWCCIGWTRRGAI